MNRRKVSLALAAFALSASFSCFAAATYKITANLLHNGESFGEPAIVVRADTLALMEVHGPDGYKLEFTVTQLVKDEIKVVAKLDSSYGTLAPVVVLKPGQPATVTVGDLSLTLTVDRTGS